MRFLIEDGGRSGIRSAEDLGDWFRAVWEIRCSIDTKFEYKSLLVDFSNTNDQQGEVFKTSAQLYDEQQNYYDQAKLSFHGDHSQSNFYENVWLDFALCYWSEAEAKLLSRTAKPRRENDDSRRKSL
jgi:hypothetical protein